MGSDWLEAMGANDGPMDAAAVRLRLERFAAHLAGLLAADAPRPLTISARATSASIGLHDRWLVQLRLEGEAFVVGARAPSGGPFADHAVKTPAELEALLPTLRASVRAWVPRLTVHALEAGQRYRVQRDFVDYAHGHFAAGEDLVFERKEFLPHDDGYTLHFGARTMYVQGETTLYDDFGLLLAVA